MSRHRVTRRPPDGDRRRRPGEHRPDPELRGRVRGAQEPVVQLGRRRAVRRAARSWPELPDVPHRRGACRHGQLERRSGRTISSRSTRARSRSTTTRSSSPTLPSTSRRRSPTSGSTTRTSSTRSSSTLPSTCSRSRRRTSASTGPATWRSRSRRSRTRDSAVGTTWPYQYVQLTAAKPPVPVTAIKPKEGTTGWSDTWMIYSKAANPNCMYLWMDHMISPEAKATVAEGFGEAPVNLEGLRPDEGPEPLRRRTTPTTRPGGRTSTTGRRRSRTAGTTTTGRPARHRRTGRPPGPRSGGNR